MNFFIKVSGLDICINKEQFKYKWWLIFYGFVTPVPAYDCYIYCLKPFNYLLRPCFRKINKLFINMDDI